MKIYDVSVPISAALPVWPGDVPIVVDRGQKIEEGADANLTHIAMGAHTGTHVDAPWHFVANGSKMEDMPLDVLVGTAVVIELPESVTLITEEVLKGIEWPADCERVLFKTSNSALWHKSHLEFEKGFVGIDVTASRFLVEKKVKLVGLDYLSVAPFGHGKPTHEILLGAGLVLLEGLDLTGVKAGKYMLCCLPMKLTGAEGAPARTILIEM